MDVNIAQCKEMKSKDWISRHRKNVVYDEPSQSFLWRPHSVAILILAISFLLYVSLMEETPLDFSYNSKRGLLASCVFFILFGIANFPAGPFIRPHPGFWKFILSISIIYELFLIFILFQTADDARQLLAQLDPSLGRPLPEKNYGSNCYIYDRDDVNDPWHNLKDKVDVFVLAHLMGWWLKALILRDFWICTITSAGFELLEYTLAHQLPNFTECWWDHWIMDFALCNWIGIYLGLKTCDYLSMKPYNWYSVWKIDTFKGKLWRILAQFSPHDWIEFKWKPTESLYRWLAVLFIIFITLLVDLLTFYLKYVLWLPPSHFYCIGRLAILFFSGGVSLRELFEYLDNSECERLGTQSWVVLSIITTELLIVLKFDFKLVSMPIPRRYAIFWLVVFVSVFLYTVWHFWIKQFLVWYENRTEKRAAELLQNR